MKKDESIALNKQEASQNTEELSGELLEEVQGAGLGFVPKSPGPGIAKWRKATPPETSTAPTNSGTSTAPTNPGTSKTPGTIPIFDIRWNRKP